MASKGEQMYLTHDDCQEIAQAIQPAFEVGGLHSQSRLTEIAPRVRDELADNGYTRNVYGRKSLVYAIAKMAQAMWIATIQKTQTEMAKGQH